MGASRDMKEWMILNESEEGRFDDFEKFYWRFFLSNSLRTKITKLFHRKIVIFSPPPFAKLCIKRNTEENCCFKRWIPIAPIKTRDKSQLE